MRNRGSTALFGFGEISFYFVLKISSEEFGIASTGAIPSAQLQIGPDPEQMDLLTRTMSSEASCFRNWAVKENWRQRPTLANK